MINNQYFEELNYELGLRNQKLKIVCAGGFALEYYKIRGTSDVDAFFNTTKDIQEAIYTVGERYNINDQEMWLNNSIRILNDDPPEQETQLIYEYSNLSVFVVTLEYLLCMKLYSAREQDIEDAGQIIQILNWTDPFTCYTYAMSKGFNIDFSLVLQAYEEAYGLDKCVEYINQNTELFAGI